jgi:hypothetical protein
MTVAEKLSDLISLGFNVQFEPGIAGEILITVSKENCHHQIRAKMKDIDGFSDSDRYLLNVLHYCELKVNEVRSKFGKE